MTTNPVTVLVVDDEIPIREELRAFPWENCGAVWIGEAENGEEALAMCDPFPPDIIVSDITMPTMDGLTLLQEVRRRYPGVQVILLTCHSEFQYAKEAIRLGAQDYILKVSLDEEEVGSAIRKAKEALIRHRGHLRQESKLNRAKASKRLEALLADFREGNGDRDVSLEREQWQRLGFGDRFPYRFARLWLPAHSDASLLAHDIVRSALVDFEMRTDACEAWFPIGSDEYTVWFSECDAANAAVPYLERCFMQVRSAAAATSLVDEGEIVLRAVVSEAIRSPADALAALHATSAWKEAAFYMADSAPYIHISMPEPPREFTEEHRRALLAGLRQAEWDADRLALYVETELAAWCRAIRVRPGPLKQWLTQRLTEWISERGAEGKAYASAAAVAAAFDLDAMVEAFVRTVRSVGAPEMKSRPEIREARMWIRDRLQDPLSLPFIAERFGLRPEYFSRLFKDETGESVNQYITRLRMEKAMELLKHSNLKVYEVAEAVGIPNYRYFTSTFRNWAGAAPTDVKRNRRSTVRFDAGDGGSPI